MSKRERERVKKVTLVDNYQGIPDGDQLVADNEPAVDLGCAAFHDFRDIYPIIAGNMLIANAPGDAETEAFVSFDELDLRHLALPPPTHALQHCTILSIITIPNSSISKSARKNWPFSIESKCYSFPKERGQNKNSFDILSYTFRVKIVEMPRQKFHLVTCQKFIFNSKSRTIFKWRENWPLLSNDNEYWHKMRPQTTAYNRRRHQFTTFTNFYKLLQTFTNFCKLFASLSGGISGELLVGARAWMKDR